MDQFLDDFDHPESGADAAANRAVSRDSLLLSAQFRLAGAKGEKTVRVRNLSAGGLMAEMSEPIDGGTAVEVNVRGVGWVPGHVAWVAAGRIGVAFDRLIDPMAARKPVVAPRRQTLDKPIRPLL